MFLPHTLQQLKAWFATLIVELLSCSKNNEIALVHVLHLHNLGNSSKYVIMPRLESTHVKAGAALIIRIKLTGQNQ